MLIEHNLPITNFNVSDTTAIERIVNIIQKNLPFLAMYININRISHTFHNIELGAFNSIDMINAIEIFTAVLNEKTPITNDNFYILSNKHILIIIPQINKKEIEQLTKKIAKNIRNENIQTISDNFLKNLAIQTFFLDIKEESNSLIDKIRFFQYCVLLDRKSTQSFDDNMKTIKEKKAVTPDNIAHAQRVISELEDIKYIDYQNVYSILPNIEPQILFRKYHFNLKNIIINAIIEVDITAEKWLMRHILCQLDFKLISFIRENYDELDVDDNTRIAIPINLSSIESHAFKTFTDWIMHEEKDYKFIICLDAIDVMAHLEKYYNNLALLRRRNINTLIENINYQTTNYYDRNILNVDYLSPSINKIHDIDIINKNFINFFRFVEKTKRDHSILRQCNTINEIEFGINAGFRLFKGFGADNYYAAWQEYLAQDNDNIII